MDQAFNEEILRDCQEVEEYAKEINLPLTPDLAKHLFRYGPPENWRSKVKKTSITKED